ncbi:transcriptional repressor [Candidatus Parcubacteria bacterium]|jgi:Fur family transcriptional regulator, peroxide stress response regulator|nr:transcriptional repressor [Candidatus Parcubacteria bacterium]
MQRNTIQKQVILDHLQGVKTHPSVDQVYLAIRKKLPTISKATVYRILKNFSQENLVKEIVSDVSHYDADLDHHTHFICQDCKQVFDMPNFDKSINFPKNVKAGKINNYQVNFFGDCNKCKNKY